MMSVDRQLQDLKEDYHNHIPTSFTEKDKQRVFQAISHETQPEKPKMKHYLFKPAAMTVYATVVLLVGGVTVTQLEPYSSSPSTETPETFDSAGGGSNPVSDSQNKAMISKEISTDFEVGDQVNGMILQDIQPNSLSFSGEKVLSGHIVTKEGTPDQYLFHISDLTKRELPLTEDHEGVLLLSLENDTQFQDLLEKAAADESFVKFITSNYSYQSGEAGADASRSITVAGVILNGEYHVVTPKK